MDSRDMFGRRGYEGDWLGLGRNTPATPSTVTTGESVDKQSVQPLYPIGKGPAEHVPIPHLPDWVPPSADDLNDIADASRVKQEVASPTLPLPVIYGRDKVPGRIAVVHVDDTNGFLYLLVSFAEPCTAVDKLYVEGYEINDEPHGLIISGGWVNTYPEGGGPSPLLVDVIPEYDDVIAACYVVFKIPKSYSRSFPKIEAIIRGKPVYDPRTDTTVYSDNPSLCFADMAVGAGWGMNWSSVEDAADFNDALVSGAKSRRIGLTLADPRPAEEWTKAFRVYTGCFIVWEGGLVRMIPDQAVTLPGDVAHTFKMDDIVADSVRLSRRNPSTFPTTVIVEYKDSTDDKNWRTERAVVEAEGVTSHRVSRVSLPGIHTYAQAYREAEERLEKFRHDLSMEVQTFDETLKLQIGSVVRVIHPLGLDRHFRLISFGNEQGRWAVKLLEYDSTAYSTSAPTAPVAYESEVGNPESVNELPPVVVPPGLEVVPPGGQIAVPLGGWMMGNDLIPDDYEDGVSLLEFSPEPWRIYRINLSATTKILNISTVDGPWSVPQPVPYIFVIFPHPEGPLETWVEVSDTQMVGRLGLSMYFRYRFRQTYPLWIHVIGVPYGISGTYWCANVMNDYPYDEPHSLAAKGVLKTNVTQTGSYIVGRGDKGRVVRINSAVANTVTIPANDDLDPWVYPASWEDDENGEVAAVLNIRQVGAGQTTIVAASGVTINSPNGLKLRAQHSQATLVWVTDNVWDLTGDVVP